MNKKMLLAITTATSLVLAACGGSDDTPPAVSTLSGTAAVGAPIVGGTVSVTCAAGSAISPVTTSSTGGWQVTASGQTLPCAIRVSNGTVNGSAQASPYHSIAVTLGVINITPLTDLLIANLSAQAPSAWFGGLTGASLQAINQNAVNTALGNIKTALGLTTALGDDNPLTTAFTPVNGNRLDDILEALANAGATHTNLLTLAQAPTFTVPASFNFQSAYSAVLANNGGATHNGSGASLTVAVKISGVASTSIPVANVPTPGSEAEFCGGIQNDNTFSQIGASGGGTLTINSCSFANKVGTINATLTITSPISMTVPYTVTYTYQ